MAAETTSCPRCSAELPASARFCVDCGARVARREGAVTWELAEPRYFGVVPGRRFLRATKVRSARVWAVTLGRLRLTRDQVASYLAAEQEVQRLRHERARLDVERERAIYDLGAAVHAGDTKETRRLRAGLGEIEAQLDEGERELEAIRTRMRDRIDQAELESGRTVIESHEPAHQ